MTTTTTLIEKGVDGARGNRIEVTIIAMLMSVVED